MNLWDMAANERQAQPLLQQEDSLVASIERYGKEKERLMTRMAHMDECAAVYRATIDKKTSDLTMRESQLVKACQAIDLYPPGN